MVPTPPLSEPDADRGASATAIGAAKLRAAHLYIDDAPPIFEDALAVRLLDPESASSIREHPDRFRTPTSLAIRCDVLVRSRYAEDRLAEAIRDGVRQYVILGAGLDTFAYRQPEWARDLGVLEVDYAASQADKRDRLKRAGLGAPPNLRYAAVDLEANDLSSALMAAGLDITKPAVVACLGVLIYLSEGAADAIFATAARLAAGSEFIFTFSRPDASTARPPAAIGEPWRTRFDPGALAAKLESSGFSSIGFLFAQDITERYLSERNDGLRAPSRVVLADATV